MAILLLLTVLFMESAVTAATTRGNPKDDPILSHQATVALRLLKEQYTSDKQSLLSPFSIAAALVYPYMGIAEQSKRYIYELLAKTTTKADDFYAFIKEKLGSLPNLGFGLDMAISFFIDDSHPIKQTFRDIKQQFAGTILGFETVNFATPPTTASIINRYVTDKTNKTITHTVTAEDIVTGRPALIVDAVHFHAAWKKPFDKKRTISKEISLGGGKVGMPSVMRATAKFTYEQRGKIKILGIPFADDGAKMFIVLPEEIDGLKALLNNLDAATLLNYMIIPTTAVVEVQLPKFEVVKKLQVWDMLAKLSNNLSFATKDNFKDITEDPVTLSHLVHQTFIKIDEHGANAPTIVQQNLPGPESTPVAEFHADHPFLYFVASSDNILLLVGTYP